MRHPLGELVPSIWGSTQKLGGGLSGKELGWVAASNGMWTPY